MWENSAFILLLRPNYRLALKLTAELCIVTFGFDKQEKYYLVLTVRRRVLAGHFNSLFPHLRQLRKVGQ